MFDLNTFGRAGGAAGEQDIGKIVCVGDACSVRITCGIQGGQIVASFLRRGGLLGRIRCQDEIECVGGRVEPVRIDCGSFGGKAALFACPVFKEALRDKQVFEEIETGVVAFARRVTGKLRQIGKVIIAAIRIPDIAKINGPAGGEQVFLPLPGRFADNRSRGSFR